MRFASDQVVDQVDVARDILEAPRLVVDSFVGAQAVVQKDDSGRDPPELHELWVAPCGPLS